MIPNPLLRRKLRRILRIPAGNDPDTSWSPLQIPGIDGYLNPGLGVTMGADNRIVALVEQVNGLTMTMPFANPAGEAGYPAGESHRWHPQRGFNVFGSNRSFKMDPDHSGIRSTYLRLPASRPLASGLSWFWVSKHTSARDAAFHGSQNVPLAVISESSVDTFSGAGFSAGKLAYSYFSGGWQEAQFGSGYNDGIARLYGITHSTTDEIKAYVNGVQVGATVTGALYFPTFQAWSAIGTGYRAEPDPDPYGGDDGFLGDVGPVIVASGIMADLYRERLYQWCQEAGWCA